MKIRARFNIDTLRELAGDKVFARGEQYFRDGLVSILSIEAKRILAQVAGTEDYRSELLGRGRNIEGECSCPAFEDWGFCKHLVATALAANALGEDAEKEGSGALDRIRRHLKDKGANVLVEMIVGLAERNPDLFRKLDIAATAAHGDEKTLALRLRRAIDTATLTRGFVEYREAQSWVAGVEDALDGLAELASGARAGLALELAERAIARIERAIESIDDSDGHCGGLLERARDIHLTAARVARPEPVQLARDLFAREMGDGYGTFYGAAAVYAEVLGEAGLAEYHRLAAKAWEKLPPVGGRARREIDSNYDRLMNILDFFAERARDVDTRISLRVKDLSSPWAYLQLAEFCLAHGRKEEALRRAEEGLWIFEDERPDERLVLFVADLLAKLGRKGDAQAHLWRAFEKAPSIDLYTRIRKVAGKAARDRAIEFLKNRLGHSKRGEWNNTAELLVSLLLGEKMFDAAWEAARAHGASASLKQELVGATEKTHPREALAFYTARVDVLANAGGDSSYREVRKLVTRIAALQGKAEQISYVTGLKARFARKRNLMKLLA